MDKIWVYTLVILVGALCAAGDVSIYQWTRTNRAAWWVLSCVLWIVAATLFGYVLGLKYFSLSIGVVVSLISHSLVVLVIDRAYYGTRLNVLQWTAVAMAIITLSLLELGKSQEVALQQKMTRHNNATK